MNNNAMTAPEVTEPMMPFPIIVNEFKKEIVSVIQRYAQKGVPFCVINDIVADFSRQCTESANTELTECNNRYNKALEDYSNYIREQEKPHEEYQQAELDLDALSSDGESDANGQN